MGSRRRGFVFALVLLLSSLLGGWLGPTLTAASSSGEDIDVSLKTFTRVLDLVEANFADVVQSEKAIYDGAITGMLRTLDPHSNFFDPRELQVFREGQKGQYFGVGMLVGLRNGRVTVMHPFLNSPAKRAGIRPADAIIAVNDRSTERMGTSEVVDMLKGPRGTPVQVSMKREGVEKPLIFNLIRDEVLRPSVTVATWVRPGVAFVKIEQFNENTSRELEAELRRLGEENIEGLILDLRDNPGGILQEAVAVSERFLEKGQSIVSQRGRISPERAFVGRRGNAGRKYPLVVLVNRSSASAAEIVSGALQDHDRAWILGDNTFGKGLVQAPYNLSGDCQLLLTIARFYTPSGRLIQRDYSKGSFFEYYYRKDTATRNVRDMKTTDAGRTVFGGGGIAPDDHYTEAPLDPLQVQLLGRFTFFYFAGHHFGAREVSLPKGWEPDEAIMKEYREFLRERQVAVTDEDFQKHKEWISRQLKIEMYTMAFGKEESDRTAAALDPEVASAIECLPKSKALLERSKKMVARAQH